MTPAFCLALAIYFETGPREPQIERIAVGWPIVTSAKTDHRKPWGVCAQVFRSGKYVGIRNYRTIPSGPSWGSARLAAADVLAWRVKDPTGGATNFECRSGNRASGIRGGVACRNLDRKFIGMELDEAFYRVSVERIGDSG